jgi:hypothetical protein
LAGKVKSSLLLGIALASALIGVALFFALNTPSDAWGASNSPARQGLLYLYAILIFDIPALTGIYLFSKKREWLAPPGRYVAGEKKYSILSPYFLAACAVMAAVETVIGVAGIANVDIVAIICAFASVFFGPLVAFVAPFIAYILRWMLGFAPWITVPVIVPGQALIDGGIWSINAIIFWVVVRRLRGNTKTIATILFIPIFILVHATGWLWLNYFTLNPYAAAIGNVLYAIGPTGFYLSSILAIIFGVLIGQFYYDSRIMSAEVAKVRAKGGE